MDELVQNGQMESKIRALGTFLPQREPVLQVTIIVKPYLGGNIIFILISEDVASGAIVYAVGCLPWAGWWALEDVS